MGQCAVKQNIDLDENDIDISQVGGNAKSQHTWMIPTISKTTRREKLVMNKRKEAAMRAISKSHYLRTLISDLTPAEFDQMFDKAEICGLIRNQVVLKNGDKADSCFILLIGNVIEYDEDMRIAQTYDEESCIGDASFMTSGEHISTYATGKNSTFFKITHKNLESITTSVPFLLRKIPMFSMVDDSEKFLKYCSSKKLKSGSEISQLGDYFYYIMCGSLNTVIEQLKAGSFFGHEQLLEATGIIKADIIVTSPTLLFILSAEGFNDPLFAEVRENLQDSVIKTPVSLPEGTDPVKAQTLPMRKSMSLVKTGKSLKRNKSARNLRDADGDLWDTSWASLGGTWVGNGGGSWAPPMGSDIVPPSPYPVDASSENFSWLAVADQYNFVDEFNSFFPATTAGPFVKPTPVKSASKKKERRAK